MNNENTDVGRFKDKLTPKQAEDIERKMQSASDEKVQSVNRFKAKSVKTTTMFSAFFGIWGGGSFYLGRYKRGVAKVIFSFVMPLVFAVIFLLWLMPLNKGYIAYGNDYKQFSGASSEARLSYTASFDEVRDATEDCTFTQYVTYADSYFSSAFDFFYKKADNTSDNKGKITIIEENIVKASKLADPELSDEFGAINDAFDKFGNEPVSDATDSEYTHLTYALYKEKLGALSAALQTVFAPEMPNGEVYIDKLREDLQAVKADETVAEEKDLKETIDKLLSALPGNSTLTALDDYVKKIADLDFSRLLQDLDEEKFAAYTKAFASFDDEFAHADDLVELIASYKNLYDNYYDGEFPLFSDFSECVQTVEYVGKNPMGGNLTALNNNVNPLPDSDGNYVKGMADLIDDIVTGLMEYKDVAEADSPVTVLSESLTSLGQRLSEQAISDKLQEVFEERQADDQNKERVNLISEFESAFAKFVAGDSCAEFRELAEAYNAATIEIADAIEQIQANLGMFNNFTWCLVSIGNVDALEYYLNAPNSAADKKIGVKATLKRCFDNYKEEEWTVITDGEAGKCRLSTLNTMAKRFANMKNEIENLNAKADAKIHSWKLAYEFCKMFSITMLSIYMTIVIAYWVGDTFRNREKCHNYNYERLNEILS